MVFPVLVAHSLWDQGWEQEAALSCREEPKGLGGGPGLSLLMDAKCLAGIQGHPCLHFLTTHHQDLKGLVGGYMSEKQASSFLLFL